jgi:glycolate oxidase FAD binding subunit
MIRPASASELARALRDADEAGLAVIPWGAGSQQYVGNPPSRADLLLETTALAGVVEHTPADLTVTVAAGTRFAELQATLGRAGQRLPLDPAHATTATIGGLTATNASGPRRQRHGTLRDLVIGTRTALVDGTIARAGGKVAKNVAGYDLNKLYIGSLGTLGVLVEATFKILPLPAREGALVAEFGSLREALEAGVAIARTPLRPTALEAHDLGGTATLVVVAEGEPTQVDRILEDAARLVGEHRARGRERRADIEALLEVTRSLPEEGRGVLLRASLPPAAQPAFADEVRRVSHERGTSLEIAAHVGAGIVRTRVLGELEAVRRAALETVAVAKSLEGEAWAERVADPLRPALTDVWYGEPPGFFLMRRIKQEFDPKSTLNPGRFVGGM